MKREPLNWLAGDGRLRVLTPFLVLGGLTACSDPAPDQYNTAPTAEILSPESDTTLAPGAIQLVGRVYDAQEESDLTTLSVQWRLDKADGEVLCEGAPNQAGQTTCGISLEEWNIHHHIGRQ